MNARDPGIEAAGTSDLGTLHATLARLRKIAAHDVHPSREERADVLRRLEAMVVRHQGEFCAAASSDFGSRSAQETRLIELFTSLEALRYNRRHLRRWMRPERRKTSIWFMPARNRVVKQPLGVVGIIVPWNYPFYLSLGPLASAIAAGNRVMLKMPEDCPAVGALLAQLVEKRIGRDWVQVFNGDADFARAFSALPFDHLLFTGSTRVGHQVMHAAADNLCPVTLELGGKSPVIVAPDYPLHKAAASIMSGKCTNAGQTCVAPDYVLVPAGREHEFVQAARACVAQCYPNFERNSDYTSIINERHYARLQRWLDEAREGGAQVMALAETGETAQARRIFAPTIVLDAPPDCSLMREEIFGPILPLVSYRTMDEAIEYVNARAKPLALYLFTHDAANQATVTRRTSSGGMAINEVLLHVAQDDLPFGGVGPSGMGRYHGKEGFDTFSHHRAVMHQSRFNSAAMLRPPFGKLMDALLKVMLR
jgi:acyl-CoA reductase-like NAD-dependent aldehyde dehydrogenase